MILKLVMCLAFAYWAIFFFNFLLIFLHLPDPPQGGNLLACCTDLTFDLMPMALLMFLRKLFTLCHAKLVLASHSIFDFCYKHFRFIQARFLKKENFSFSSSFMTKRSKSPFFLSCRGLKSVKLRFTI